MAGSQALYDVEGLGGPDALALAKYDELIDASGIWHQGWLTRVGVHDVERLTTLLDMLNTGFLLTAPVPGLIPVSFSDVSFAARDSLKLGKRRSAWPRAFFTDGATTYADPADLLRTAAIHGPVAAIRAGDYEAAELTRAVMRPATAVVPARGYKITTNTTSFVVHATGPGLAVLAEAYIPNDFVATVNGRYSRYFCVNHAFKGVFIPSAGDWEVTFEYRPARWRQAWFLAAVGLTLLLVFAYLPVRHRNAAWGSGRRTWRLPVP